MECLIHNVTEFSLIKNGKWSHVEQLKKKIIEHCKKK